MQQFLDKIGTDHFPDFDQYHPGLTWTDKGYCNAPATKWTGRVLYLKARHAVSIIAAKDWRLGVAFPRVVTMGDATVSPAVEWQQG